MSDGDGLNEDIVVEVEKLLRDGTVEGLARRLRRDFPALAAEADAAIGHGVSQLIVRPHSPRDCGAYLAACAYNELKRLAQHQARQESLDAFAADPDRDRQSWEPADVDSSAEEQALRRITYDLLRSHVKTWDTETVRVVTLLYLEAAFEGEPLPSDDAAELASELLGYDVDANFVRTWKSRGFRKLREYVNAVDIIDGQREETKR